MSGACHYLSLSSDRIFHLRIRIPQAISAYYDRKNIKFSLKTRCRKIAKIRAFLAAGTILYKLDTLLGMATVNDDSTITPESIRLIIKEELDRAIIEIKQSVLGTDSGKFISTPSTNHQLARNNEVIDTKISQENRVMLSVVADKYIHEKERSGAWSNRSIQENHYIIKSLLLGILGDLPCESIAFEHARQVKETLLILPPHISKKSKYKGKPIAEILKMPNTESMSFTTINKALGIFSSVFEYAVRHGYTKINPFEGMKLQKTTRAQDERLPFSSDDLVKLFSSELYTKPAIKKDFHYWLPLLGLYTGCRLGELAGLYVSDIRKNSDIWVISINDENDKSVKTKSSIREVPIANKLIELGFLTYVEHVQSGRLFKDLTKTRDGYGLGATKWFNRTYKPSVGIDNKLKVFHSFRHLVSSKLVNTGISREIAGAVLGHHDPSQTTGRYGDGFKIKVLKEAIEKLNFDEELYAVKSWSKI